MSALAGVVVVDLTTQFWASIAAALLGDFGADVIHIEDPAGDGRAAVLGQSDEHEAGRWNYRFDLANRNKRSLAIDVDSDDGRALLAALIAKADVVITDEPADLLRARSLDYASICRLREDTVYVRGSGLGPEGPDADLPALDEIAAARTGMMPILPEPGQPPVYPGHGQMYTSVLLALGTVMALFHRRATGQGQEVHSSLLAGNMYGASLDLQAYLAIGGQRLLEPVSRLDAGNPMSGTKYPTKEGLWITLTMPDTDRWWPMLAEMVGLDENDERFNTHDKRCEDNRIEMMQVLDERFRQKPAAHWRALFNEKQASADVIEDYTYPEHDPSARDNGYLLELEDASLGPLTMLGFPIFMSDTPASLAKTAPRLGQHTTEILRSVLGVDYARVVELRARGVVAG